jgi:hypothetical protein
MDDITMYSNNFNANDSDIITELKDAKTGELLPEQGASRFFNEAVEFDGQFLLLKDDKNFIICYIDNEIAIDAIDIDNAQFHIQRESDRTILTLVIKNSTIPSNFTLIFKHNNQSNIDALQKIKADKEIEIFFLSPAFGGFIKAKHNIFKLSEDLLKNILN